MNRRSFVRGEILLCDLVFSTGQGVKKRPVLVVADLDDADILVVPITSHPARGEFDCAVYNWQEAGLKLPSTIRVNKLATVAKECVLKDLGRLSSSDAKTFQDCLRSLFVELSD